uniref:Uncharacterized protein n=1 Tax=Macrostomum lignano TaxID=282301 RepID=A0A1I8FEP4_9PLAT
MTQPGESCSSCRYPMLRPSAPGRVRRHQTALGSLLPGCPAAWPAAGGPQRVAASVLPLIRGLAEAPPGRLLAFVDLRSAVGWRLCFRWQMTGAAANSDGDGGGGGNWQAVGGSSPMRLREGATFAVRLTGQLQLKLATSAAVQFRQACPNLPVVMAVKPSEAAAAEAARQLRLRSPAMKNRGRNPSCSAQLTVADEYNSVVLSAELSYNLESLSQLQQALTVPAEAALEKQQPAAAPPPSSPAIKKAAASQSPKSAGLGSRPGRLLPRQQPATEAAAVNRDREPRVLSGRSLQALAEHLQQRQLGQHLARLLHLPDATVAGLGFDTARGGNLAGNRESRLQGAAAVETLGAEVETLALALASTGEAGLADTVRRCHAANREFAMPSAAAVPA